MSRGGLRRLGALLGATMVVGFGCGRVIVSGEGDGDTSGTESGTGGGTSSSAGSSGGGTGTGSSGGGSTTTGTGTTAPICAIYLADVAAGIGGFAMDGEAEDDGSGRSMSGAGDVNGDGHADVVVGALRADANGVYDSGRSYVVFGKADTDKVQLAEVTAGIGGFAVNGEEEEDRSGQRVSGAGDVNGDGLADVLVGAPWATPNGADSGRTYVVFGKADTAPVELADVALGVGGFVVDGDAGNHSGSGLSAAGDVNGDGLDDLVMADTEAEPNDLARAGRVYVVFGKTDGMGIALSEVTQGIGGFAVEGAAQWAWAGYSVSSAGDMNGDDLADLVVASPGAPDDSDSGSTYVVFGKTDAQNVSLADVAEGIGGFAMVGEPEDNWEEDYGCTSVSGAGDVNDDGTPDIILGARGAGPNGLYGAGRAYLVLGKADTDTIWLSDVAQGVGGFVMDGSHAYDGTAWKVGGIGDLNDDGLSDVFVAGMGGGTGVVFGKADTGSILLSDVVEGVGGFVVHCEDDGYTRMTSLGGAGDVNLDGIPDIAISARQPGGTLAYAGRTYVVFGGDFSCEGE